MEDQRVWECGGNSQVRVQGEEAGLGWRAGMSPSPGLSTGSQFRFRDQNKRKVTINKNTALWRNKQIQALKPPFPFLCLLLSLSNLVLSSEFLVHLHSPKSAESPRCVSILALAVSSSRWESNL